VSFRNKLKYFLVHTAQFKNSEAQAAIESGKIIVNGNAVFKNCVIVPEDEITYQSRILQQGIKHRYFLFYKPKGIETTHNLSIEHSLANKFPELKHLFFAGRLDKDSEGLLFLTTNGKFANTLAHPAFKQEKEYLVKVNKPIDELFKNKMESGVEIMGYKTKNCSIEIVGTNEFRILLQEGKNRQIRRMCYKLGYAVLELKRTKIAGWSIDGLKVGEWEEIQL